MSRKLYFLLLASSFCLSTLAQGTPSGVEAWLVSAPLAWQAAPQLPPFRAGIDIIQLDVSVLDRNRQPIRGLTAADFTVLQDGKAQDIVAFESVDIAGATEPEAPWMRDAGLDVSTNDTLARRVVVIVFDDAHMPLDSTKMATRIARDVLNNLGPQDFAAVTFTDSGRRQDITTDRQRLLKSVDSLVPHPGGLACRYRGPFRSSAACVIDTLVTAAKALKEAPLGRKSLIYISSGVPFNFQMSDLRGIDDASDDIRAIMTMLSSLQAGNVNVYAIDPAGLTAEGIMSPRLDALRIFAENTGGFATIATNTPWVAVPQIFRENSSYYLLGIKSGVPPRDSTFHKIQIKVDRPGAEVRTRPGFLAEGTRKAVNTREVEPVEKAVGLPTSGGSVPLSVTLAPFATPRQKTADLAIAIAFREPPADRQAFEIMVMALDSDCGECRKLPTQRQRVTLSAPAGASRPVDVLARLKLPPGGYEIRVAAAADGVAGNVLAHVDIPDYTKDKFTASGLVLGADTGVVVDRSVLNDVLPLVPTAVREFRRETAVTAFLRFYQGGSRTPEAVRVSTTIRDAADGVNVDQTAFLDSKAFGATRSVDYRLDLPMGRLEAGAHLLTIDAHMGALSVTRSARFTVR